MNVCIYRSGCSMAPPSGLARSLLGNVLDCICAGKWHPSGGSRPASRPRPRRELTFPLTVGWLALIYSPPREGSVELFFFDFLPLLSSGEKKKKLKMCSGFKGNNICGWYRAALPLLPVLSFTADSTEFIYFQLYEALSSMVVPA